MLAPVGADGANGLGNLVVGLGDVRQLVGLAAEQSLDRLGGVAGVMGSMSATWSPRSNMGRQAAGQRLTANMKPAAQGWAMTVPLSVRR
jgi:hypothetical protein